MSRGIITNIDDAENNNYTITIPHLGEVKAQCVSVDEILLGTEVRFVDVDNIDPAKSLTFGPLRFLPNTHPDQTTENIPNYLYTNGGVWKKPSELYNTNNRHSLVVSYILSSERNPKWQREYPLYKRGKVVSITDEKYMKVNIYGDMARSCRTDYMTCDTAAFAVDDIVIIFYENGSFFKPVVVGFWEEPKTCVLWQTYIYLASHWGKFIKCCPDIGAGNTFWITNVEWFVSGTWYSRFDTTHYPEDQVTNGTWDGSKWICTGNFCQARLWIDSGVSQTEWLNTNRPTKIRITWSDQANTGSMLYNLAVEILSSDSFYYNTATTLTRPCGSGYTSGTEIALDWTGIPEFIPAGLDI